MLFSPACWFFSAKQYKNIEHKCTMSTYVLKNNIGTEDLDLLKATLIPARKLLKFRLIVQPTAKGNRVLLHSKEQLTKIERSSFRLLVHRRYQAVGYLEFRQSLLNIDEKRVKTRRIGLRRECAKTVLIWTSIRTSAFCERSLTGKNKQFLRALAGATVDVSKKWSSKWVSSSLCIGCWNTMM